MADKTVYVIIPAAGKSIRMGSATPKILMEVSGIPVIIRTLMAFDGYKDKDVEMKVVVVTGSTLLDDVRDLIEQYRIRCVNAVIEGGETRTKSVGYGVEYLRSSGVPDDALVFIHDGARCLIEDDVISDCISTMETNQACIAAVLARNTTKIIRRIEGDIPSVVSTPNRNDLVEVQTPQCFRFRLLSECYEYAATHDIAVTDDSSIAELLGYEVKVCNGSYTNIKITTPEDISIAEAILNRRSCP